MRAPRPVAVLLLCLPALVACGAPTGEGNRVEAPGPTPAAALRVAVTSDTPTNEPTKSFFGRLVGRQTGDEVGAIDLRDSFGILVHPGASLPSIATFRLDGELQDVRLRLFIAPLPPEARTVPQAGTVYVKVRVDDSEALARVIDRYTLVDQLVSTAGARQLTIETENADGKAWWDWLFVSVEEATPATAASGA